MISEYKTGRFHVESNSFQIHREAAKARKLDAWRMIGNCCIFSPMGLNLNTLSDNMIPEFPLSLGL